MPLHLFPLDFVFWQTLDDHEEIKSELLPVILKENEENKNNPFPNCRFNTGFYNTAEKTREKNPFLYKDDIIKRVVDDNLHDMISKCNYSGMPELCPCSFLVRAAWWNVYQENDFQEFHRHDGEPIVTEGVTYYPAFSLVYILHDENETSSLTFRKNPPLPALPPYWSSEYHTATEPTIKEGTVLIFPYNLMHMAIPSVKSGRVTLAYNIYASWVEKK